MPNIKRLNLHFGCEYLLLGEDEAASTNLGAGFGAVDGGTGEEGGMRDASRLVGMSSENLGIRVGWS